MNRTRLSNLLLLFIGFSLSFAGTQVFAEEDEENIIITSDNSEEEPAENIRTPDEDAESLSGVEETQPIIAAPEIIISPCVTVAKIVSTGVSVTWNRVEGADGYEIYRKKDNGTFTLITTVPSSSTSFTDTSVRTTLATYTYHVTPTGSASVAVQNDASVFHQYVSPVTFLSLSLNNRTGAVVTGTRSDVTGYQVQYSTNKNFSSASVVNSTSNSKAIYSLLQNTTYYFRIRGYRTYNNKSFFGPWSSIRSIKTSSAKPSVKLFRQTDSRWKNRTYRT